MNRADDPRLSLSQDQRKTDGFVPAKRRFMIRVYLWSLPPFLALLVGMITWGVHGLSVTGIAIGFAVITGLFVGLSPVVAVIRFANDPRGTDPVTAVRIELPIPAVSGTAKMS